MDLLLQDFDNVSYSFIVKGIVDEPPVSPLINDQYIIHGAKDSSLFKDVPDDSIALYDGTQWIINIPHNGDLLYNLADNSIMYYAYIAGAYKWSESTRFDKNYSSNLLLKAFYKIYSSSPTRFLQNQCYYFTFKDYNDDTIPAPIKYMFKFNKNNASSQIKFFNVQWNITPISQYLLVDNNHKLLCIDDCTFYIWNGSTLSASHKASPNVIYYDNAYNGSISLYDDKEDKLYIFSENIILAGNPTTSKLTANPPTDPRQGGMVQFDQQSTAIAINTSNNHQTDGMMFFKYNIVNYSIPLSSSNVTSKQVTLRVPVAVGKSGVKSMRLAVNGVTQIEGDDYTITNNNTTISWNGLGMDQLGFQELINNNKKIVFDVMYMVERAIKVE